MAEFRKMRRCNQYIPQEEVEQILRSATSGVLNLTGDDGYPYGVPLSFVYLDGKIVFHCGREGHKIDAIRKNEKCSFTIISQDKVVPEKYSTFFKSVIAFGKIHIVDEPSEMRRLVGELAEKYRPDHDEEKNKEIDREFSALRMLVMEIEHITGKESKFLAAERREPGSSKNIVTD